MNHYEDKPYPLHKLNESDQIIVEELDKMRNKMNDPEFQKKYERKRQQVKCATCFIYFFCCPCILIKRLFGL